MGQKVSIEHILPQRPAENSEWLKNFSEEDLNEWTDKLGNLVVVTRRKNILLGNFDYHEKRKSLEKEAEPFSHLYHIYITYSEWTPTELKQNQAEVIAKLLEAYK